MALCKDHAHTARSICFCFRGTSDDVKLKWFSYTDNVFEQHNRRCTYFINAQSLLSSTFFSRGERTAVHRLIHNGNVFVIFFTTMYSFGFHRQHLPYPFCLFNITQKPLQVLVHGLVVKAGGGPAI